MTERVTYLLMVRYEGQVHWQEYDHTDTPITKKVKEEVLRLNKEAKRDKIADIKTVKRILTEEVVDED